jgi:hypothetical protein
LNTIQKQLSIVQSNVDTHQTLPTSEKIARDCHVSRFKAKAIIRRYMIVQYIKKYTEENGLPPTRRKISKMLCIPLSVTQYHVDQLARANVIHVLPGHARAIYLSEKSA